MNESNNKSFNAYLVNTNYTDVVNGTVRNRCAWCGSKIEGENK